MSVSRRRTSRRHTPNAPRDLANVSRRRSAASADHVDHAAPREVLDHIAHGLGRFVVFAEFIGQAGVRMDADEGRGNSGKFLDVGAQRGSAQGAVESGEKRLGMGDRVPEGGAGLAREGAAAGVGDGAGHHEWQARAALFEGTPDAKQGCLRVQGVEDGLDHQQVDAAAYQGGGGFNVRFFQVTETDVAKPGILDIGGDAGGAVGGAEHTGNESWPLRRGVGIRGASRDLRGCQVHIVDGVLKAIVGLGDARCGKRVGLDDIRARVEIGVVGVLDHVRPGERQHVAVAL